MFAAIPVFIYQGAITVIAALCGAVIPQELIDQLSFVGSALIFCVGFNTTFGKMIKVGNMLPALLVPIAVEVIRTVI